MENMFFLLLSKGWSVLHNFRFLMLVHSFQVVNRYLLLYAWETSGTSWRKGKSCAATHCKLFLLSSVSMQLNQFFKNSVSKFRHLGRHSSLRIWFSWDNICISVIMKWNCTSSCHTNIFALHIIFCTSPTWSKLMP